MTVIVRLPWPLSADTPAQDHAGSPHATPHAPSDVFPTSLAQLAALPPPPPAPLTLPPFPFSHPAPRPSCVPRPPPTPRAPHLAPAPTPPLRTSQSGLTLTPPPTPAPRSQPLPSSVPPSIRTPLTPLPPQPIRRSPYFLQFISGLLPVVYLLPRPAYPCCTPHRRPTLSPRTPPPLVSPCPHPPPLTPAHPMSCSSSLTCFQWSTSCRHSTSGCRTGRTGCPYSTRECITWETYRWDHTAQRSASQDCRPAPGQE